MPLHRAVHPWPQPHHHSGHPVALQPGHQWEALRQASGVLQVKRASQQRGGQLSWSHSTCDASNRLGNAMAWPAQLLSERANFGAPALLCPAADQHLLSSATPAAPSGAGPGTAAASHGTAVLALRELPPAAPRSTQAAPRRKPSRLALGPRLLLLLPLLCCCLLALEESQRAEGELRAAVAAGWPRAAAAPALLPGAGSEGRLPAPGAAGQQPVAGVAAAASQLLRAGPASQPVGAAAAGWGRRVPADLLVLHQRQVPQRLAAGPVGCVCVSSGPRETAQALFEAAAAAVCAAARQRLPPPVCLALAASLPLPISLSGQSHWQAASALPSAPAKRLLRLEQRCVAGDRGRAKLWLAAEQQSPCVAAALQPAAAQPRMPPAPAVGAGLL